MANDQDVKPNTAQDSLDACRNASNYPLNLNTSGQSLDVLQLYKERLDLIADKLWAKKSKEALFVFKLLKDSQKWTFDGFFREDQLANYLERTESVSEQDGLPSIEVYFINTSSFPELLDMTHGMLTLLLTHYHVMPQFLDFLPVEYNLKKPIRGIGGLWSSMPSPLGNSAMLPGPPRVSGPAYEFQVSYTLCAPRMVEEKPVPFRLFSASVHHGLDVQKRRSYWILTHATRLRNSLSENIQDDPFHKTSHPDLVEEHLRVQLQFHLTVCSSLLKDWKSYINHMSQEIDRFTCDTRPPCRLGDSKGFETNIPDNKLPIQLRRHKEDMSFSEEIECLLSGDLFGPTFLERGDKYNTNISLSNTLEEKLIKAARALELGSLTLKQLSKTFLQFQGNPEFTAVDSKRLQDIFRSFQAQLGQHFEALDTYAGEVKMLLAVLRASQSLLTTHLNVEGTVNLVKLIRLTAERIVEETQDKPVEQLQSQDSAAEPVIDFNTPVMNEAVKQSEDTSTSHDETDTSPRAVSKAPTEAIDKPNELLHVSSDVQESFEDETVPQDGNQARVSSPRQTSREITLENNLLTVTTNISLRAS